MFTLPDLPYDYNALEPYIDELTMHLHHDKHHQIYVDNLNKALEAHPDLLNLSIEDLMQNLHKVPEEIKTKVKNNGGGHYNHSLFWKVMAPNAGGEPTGDLLAAIIQNFESFEKFKEQFTAAATGRFGSGWAWVLVDGDKLVITDTPNQDNPLMEGKTPILGLDVWEHAYYLKYQNLRVEYIKNWWNVVNWSEVSARFAATKSK